MMTDEAGGAIQRITADKKITDRERFDIDFSSTKAVLKPPSTNFHGAAIRDWIQRLDAEDRGKREFFRRGAS